MKAKRLTTTCWMCISIALLTVGCRTAPSADADERGTTAPRRARTTTPFTATLSAVAEREKMAGSGRFLVDGRRGVVTKAATAQEMAAALDLDADTYRNASYSGSPAAGDVLTKLGVINIPEGEDGFDSFVYLSTGTVATIPEPGTDFAPSGAEGDTAVLKVEIDVPKNRFSLHFDYLFLSAEYPEWINSAYNDTFKVRVTDRDGTREKAIATVNSAEFFSASDSRADNTKFDIFTDEPAGVDEQFTGGDPDAGLTSFQTGVIDVADNNTVAFELIIHDEGDGLLDSAVIVNNVRFEAVEALDPNPSLLTPSGNVTRDTVDLVRRGASVSGVVADGVTLVLIRMQVPKAGTVDFSISGADAEQPTLADGGLRTIGSTDAPTPILGGVETVEDEASGRHFALCLYVAPDDFCRPDNVDDPTARERAVTIDAKYVSDDTGEDQVVETGSKVLSILRPPLVLVHGIWSRPEDWRLKLDTDSPSSLTCQTYNEPTLSRRFHVACVDYSLSQAAGFDQNVPSVGKTIRGALEQMRWRDIAATQVDVVAHCTGGLLARKHIARESEANPTDNYRNAQNFFAGDVNRLITLNTPHLGSKIAKVVAETRDYLEDNHREEELDRFKNALVKPGLDLYMIVDQGGVDDLVPDSAALSSIPETEVPSHAFVGLGGLTLAKKRALNAVSPRQVLYVEVEQRHPDQLEILTDQSNVFSEEHDIFTQVSSQQGGIANEATTAVSITAANQWATHFRAFWSALYSATIMDLLNSPATGEGSPFAFFPAVSSLQDSGARAKRLATTASKTKHGTGIGRLEAVEGGLYMESPADGSAVSPGGTITVRVVAGNGFIPELVLVLTRGDAALLEDAPYETEFVVPVEAIGTIPFVAYGYGAGGQNAISNEVLVDVTSSAQLVGVRVMNRDPVLSGRKSRRQIRVHGLFDDGVERDITASGLGTEYLSSAPGVLSVSGDGVITALGHGVVTLVARNSGLQDSVSVTAIDDDDGDGIPGEWDNCPFILNPKQADTDGDGLGDACDPCPFDPGNDVDGDGVCGDVDNCPEVFNPEQNDEDDDGRGDACDPCPSDPLDDMDGDDICGDEDNCPEVYNPEQTDGDDDGGGDVCDPCPSDPLDDIDRDDICGDEDNCPEVYNPDQSDIDLDGVGDLCDMAISVGRSHSCALLENGGLKCWGLDNAGQLGDGSNNASKSLPVDVVELGGRVVAVDAGGWHTCALLGTGTVQCWGLNLAGQLGNGGDPVSKSLPVDVIGLDSRVTEIAAGGLHSCAVTVDGGVWCWGSNLAGQLGDGTRELERATPVRVVGLDGPVKTVRAGDSHTCALLDSGKVQCWGLNLAGQLGDGGMPYERNVPIEVLGLGAGVLDISLGDSHSCARLEDGAAACWGANNQGQLGHGVFDSGYDIPVEVVGLSDSVSAVSAGGEHTCIQLLSGVSQCFGADTHGQLGDGMDVKSQSAPVDVVGLRLDAREISAGGGHTCALMGPAVLQCWGAGVFGQLGNGEMNDSGIPVDVTGL